MSTKTTNGGLAAKYKKEMLRNQKIQTESFKPNQVKPSTNTDDSKLSEYDRYADSDLSDVFDNFEIEENTNGELVFRKKGKKRFVVKFIFATLFYLFLSVLLIGVAYVAIFISNPSLALEILSKFYELFLVHII